MTETTRVNLVLDADTLNLLDALAASYGLNRSESVRFIAEILDGMNALGTLETIAEGIAEERAERYGYAARSSVTKYDLLRAAQDTEVCRKQT